MHSDPRWRQRRTEGAPEIREPQDPQRLTLQQKLKKRKIRKENVREKKKNSQRGKLDKRSTSFSQNKAVVTTRVSKKKAV